MPGVPHRVDHRARGTLDGRHYLANRLVGRGLAGLRVLPVEQHRAGRAEAGAAAELRALHPERLAEYPQQRCLPVPVVNFDLGTVDDELHRLPPSSGPCERCCMDSKVARTQVSCPHRMLVIAVRRYQTFMPPSTTRSMPVT